MPCFDAELGWPHALVPEFSAQVFVPARTTNKRGGGRAALGAASPGRRGARPRFAGFNAAQQELPRKIAGRSGNNVVPSPLNTDDEQVDNSGEEDLLGSYFLHTPAHEDDAAQQRRARVMLWLGLVKVPRDDVSVFQFLWPEFIALLILCLHIRQQREMGVDLISFPDLFHEIVKENGGTGCRSARTSCGRQVVEQTSGASTRKSPSAGTRRLSFLYYLLFTDLPRPACNLYAVRLWLIIVCIMYVLLCWNRMVGTEETLWSIVQNGKQVPGKQVLTLLYLFLIAVLDRMLHSWRTTKTVFAAATSFNGRRRGREDGAFENGPAERLRILRQKAKALGIYEYNKFARRDEDDGKMNRGKSCGVEQTPRSVVQPECPTGGDNRGHLSFSPAVVDHEDRRLVTPRSCHLQEGLRRRRIPPAREECGSRENSGHEVRSARSSFSKGKAAAVQLEMHEDECNYRYGIGNKPRVVRQNSNTMIVPHEEQVEKRRDEDIDSAGAAAALDIKPSIRVILQKLLLLTQMAVAHTFLVIVYFDLRAQQDQNEQEWLLMGLATKGGQQGQQPMNQRRPAPGTTDTGEYGQQHVSPCLKSLANFGFLLALYLIYATYLALSSLQLRYATKTAEPISLTRSVDLFSKCVFQLYMVTPFLNEFRVLCDWVVTKTSLDVYMWFKLEDLFTNLYLVKYDMTLRRQHYNKENDEGGSGSGSDVDEGEIMEPSDETADNLHGRNLNGSDAAARSIDGTAAALGKDKDAIHLENDQRRIVKKRRSRKGSSAKSSRTNSKGMRKGTSAATKRPRFSGPPPRSVFEKITNGGCLLLVIFFLMIGPLLLFSTINPNTEATRVQTAEASVLLTVASREKIRKVVLYQSKQGTPVSPSMKFKDEESEQIFTTPVQGFDQEQDEVPEEHGAADEPPRPPPGGHEDGTEDQDEEYNTKQRILFPHASDELWSATPRLRSEIVQMLQAENIDKGKLLYIQFDLKYVFERAPVPDTELPDVDGTKVVRFFNEKSLVASTKQRGRAHHDGAARGRGQENTGVAAVSNLGQLEDAKNVKIERDSEKLERVAKAILANFDQAPAGGGADANRAKKIRLPDLYAPYLRLTSESYATPILSPFGGSAAQLAKARRYRHGGLRHQGGRAAARGGPLYNDHRDLPASRKAGISLRLVKVDYNADPADNPRNGQRGAGAAPPGSASQYRPQESFWELSMLLPTQRPPPVSRLPSTDVIGDTSGGPGEQDNDDEADDLPSLTSVPTTPASTVSQVDITVISPTSGRLALIPPLTFETTSERVLRGVTYGQSKSTSATPFFSILGLYSLIVYAAFKMIRAMFELSSERVIYTEMEDTEFFEQICTGIYLARSLGDLKAEYDLYFCLLRLYRCPDMLLHYSSTSNSDRAPDHYGGRRSLHDFHGGGGGTGAAGGGNLHNNYSGGPAGPPRGPARDLPPPDGVHGDFESDSGFSPGGSVGGRFLTDRPGRQSFRTSSFRGSPSSQIEFEMRVAGGEGAGQEFHAATSTIDGHGAETTSVTRDQYYVGAPPGNRVVVNSGHGNYE
ncbi:unnamed protein product [Amoebophrya sp. A120]|nr:unnamed protein product [Amoebophrya sp. A120]|eukprot:GSA120T00004393001.1